jgi:peptide deformylase
VAILPILKYPDPRLAAKASEVTVFDEALKQLAADMAETMYKAPGVGLAATQVDRHIRLIVIDVTEEKEDLKVFINPKIVEQSTETKPWEEGCLSLPGIYDKVTRPAEVTVEAQDLDGKTFRLHCDGLLAVCIQHEMDHLEGIVFIDHLSMLKKSRICTKIRKQRLEEARAAKND